MDRSLLRTVRQLKAHEKGPSYATEAALRIALAYPSPYRAGMSSLGFQTIYRLLNERPDTLAERTFLPDKPAQYRRSKTRLFTFETESQVSSFDVVAISVAYELEITGMLELLSLSGIPVQASERDAFHPLILAGGPLTFSNPLPLAPFVDVILMGEAEEGLHEVLELINSDWPDRAALLEALSRLPGIYVPTVHGESLPPILQAPDAMLPAHSVLMTRHTELSDMFLVEAERGCSRGCAFCVMRRSTNGGMRIFPLDRVLATIPDHARKVGLVGAAVSDHPRLPDLLRALVDSGRGIGISSLRADRLTPELFGLLAQGGYRQLTVASDGASETLRKRLDRRIHEHHLLRAAEWAAEAKMTALKLYMMVGVPGETDEDIEELIRFTLELSRILPIAIGVSPFVAKRNTPLDGSPFEEIPVISRRLKRLAEGIRPRAEVRPTSAKWAWIEYRLAQGGWRMGEAALEAWRKGGSFADWKRAIRDIGGPVDAPWRQPSARTSRTCGAASSS